MPRRDRRRGGGPVTVLPGLRQVEAGQYEGQPIADAQQYEIPMAWLRSDRGARIPGSINGDELDARFDDAVQTIYDSGDLNPVAFSHSTATMVWVLMNVNNPDISLYANNPLPNMGHIVVVGSPREGWTLTDWNGTSIQTVTTAVRPRGPEHAIGPGLGQIPLFCNKSRAAMVM